MVDIDEYGESDEHFAESIFIRPRGCCRFTPFCSLHIPDPEMISHFRSFQHNRNGPTLSFSRKTLAHVVPLYRFHFDLAMNDPSLFDVTVILAKLINQQHRLPSARLMLYTFPDLHKCMSGYLGFGQKRHLLSGDAFEDFLASRRWVGWASDPDHLMEMTFGRCQSYESWSSPILIDSIVLLVFRRKHGSHLFRRGESECDRDFVESDVAKAPTIDIPR